MRSNFHPHWPISILQPRGEKKPPQTNKFDVLIRIASAINTYRIDHIGPLIHVLTEYSDTWWPGKKYDSLMKAIGNSWLQLPRRVQLRIRSKFPIADEHWLLQFLDTYERPVEVPGSRKVFIVHRHDEAAKESVARFLERLKLNPVIGAIPALLRFEATNLTFIVKLPNNILIVVLLARIKTVQF